MSCTTCMLGGKRKMSKSLKFSMKTLKSGIKSLRLIVPRLIVPKLIRKTRKTRRKRKIR